MRKIEHSYQVQDRWNETKGRENLERIKQCPQEFQYDLSSFDNRKQDMLNSLGDVKNLRILDFGSGRGEISVVLAKRGALVTGIEVGPDLVALAKEVAEVNEVECEFVVGSIHELPFPDESFDHVVGGAILHHLPRQGVQKALSEAHRVLRPGGVAVFVECLENSAWFDTMQNMFAVGKPGTPSYRPSILNRKAWKDYLETADDRNLTNAELETAGAPFKEIHFRYYVMTGRLRRLIRGKAFAWATRSIDRVLCGEWSPIKKLSQSALVTFRK